MHKFSYNKFNELENPTVVLSTKYHKHLGTLTNVDISTIECNFNMASAQEISFDLYRYKDDIEELLWDSVVDFKYIFVPEHQEYYSIEVQIDENNNTVKHITGTSACEFELSNRILYNFECNTESDILQDDYVVTKFYNPENPKGSLLHRVLADKCPDYTIAHVDSSLKDIQRTFSANGQDIYSFLTGTIAEEVECLFVFNSVSRTISAYDLKFVCNSCGHRGDLSVTCPECGSSEYYGKYGETTNIFISSENFAEQITRSGDTDNVFNCLKISGGDDVIDTALMYINPNGTQYLYNFNQETLADMPDELIQKIIQYNELYNSLKEPYTQESKRYFDAVDEKGYLEHSMMPEVTTPTTDAQTEADNLPSAFSNFGDISVTNITSLSSTSANLAVQGMAKVLVDPRYEVKVSGNISSLIDGTSRNWTGTATITNIGNDEDTATTASFTVKIIGNNYEKYLYQRILKQLDRDDSVFFTIFDIDNINTFKEELTKYSKSLLEGFYNSYETCLNVLIENGVTDENSVFYDVNLYNEMYSPYKQRLDLIQSEINIRDLQIAEQDEIITQSKNAIASYHNRLDFKKYIGNDLWIIFSHYRKESEYSNENYVSDGLDNAGVIDKAKELFEVCEKEIKKASQLQYSLTCNLNNLLNTKEFSNYKEKIQIGNWITLKIDEKLYYLRLINIKVNYGSLDKITISFSTAVVVNSIINDTKSIFDQIQNIASSYDTVKHQAEQGDNANINVNNWLTDGLNSALVMIKNNINEEVTYDNNGILLRSFDDILDEYSPKQSRLTSNIFAFTDDNWKTAKLGIGEHNYVKYNTTTKTFQQDTGYGLSAEFVTAGYVNGSQIIGGDIYSQNYSSINKTGTVLHLNDGTFSFGGEKLVYDGNTFTLKDVVMRWDSINTPEISDIDGLSTTLYNIESNISELDDRIQTFSQNTDPSSDWTTNEEKEKHISDIWFNTNNSKTYIYTKSGNTYSWVETNDSTLMSLATGKSTIFVSKPNTPDVTGYYYHAGDLWILQSDVTLNNTAYKSKTVLTALNSRATGFVESDWVPATTESAEQALSDISDMANDSKLTPVEKIQIKRRLAEIDDEKILYNARKTAYSSYSTVITAWTAYNTKYTALKNQSVNWNLDSSTTTDISNNTFTKYFTQYYTAKEALDSALENASKQYAEDKASDVQNNLDSFQSKVQGALTGSPSTEIGTDYIISPKIGGGYLYIKNANDGRSVTIDPKQSYSSNGYIFKVTDSNGNITIGADSSGNANFSGNITATSGKIGDWTISGSLLIGQTSTGSYSGYKTVLQPPGSGYWGIAVGVPSGDTSWGNAPFRVSHDGNMIATNATITGSITGSTISGGSITGTTINNGNGTFQVTVDGKIFATAGKIGSWIISNVGIQAWDNDKTIWSFLRRPKFSGSSNDVVFGIGEFRDDAPEGFGKQNFGVTSYGDVFIRHNLQIGDNTSYNTGAIKLWQTLDTYVGINLYNSSGLYSNGNISVEGNGSTTGIINCVKLNQTSDRGWKQDIVDLDENKASKFIYSLKPSEFKFRNSINEKHHGFVAQDVDLAVYDKEWSIVSDVSIKGEDGQEKTYKAIAYTELLADMVSTIQSLNKRIKKLESEINNYE